MQAATCEFSKKEALIQVFCYEFCEIFKNTFFYRTTPMAAFRESYVNYCSMPSNVWFDKLVGKEIFPKMTSSQIVLPKDVIE